MTQEVAPPDLALDARPADPAQRFGRFAWGALAYTLVVILFGAVVRITGSGAGCGQHWPTCHGEVAHLPARVETAIELTHRATSGISMLVVFGLTFWAFRLAGRGSPLRKASAWASIFMIIEALIGAALVLLGLTGENTSVARAAVMSAHLVNTSFLVGAMTLTAWWATRPAPARWLPRSGAEWILPSALALTLVVSVTGAITALGDTLYPVEPGAALGERLRGDADLAATFLERGRAIHPIVATLVGSLLLWVGVRGRSQSPFGTALCVAVVVQIGAGVVNVLLFAPGWMQVLHLALANALWIVLVLLWTESRRPTPAS